MYNLLYEASDIVIGIINMTTRLAALFFALSRFGKQWCGLCEQTACTDYLEVKRGGHPGFVRAALRLCMAF